MKIILISDVHGNLPALEAVLKHGRTHGGEQIWNLGDYIGYGAFPDEVVSLLSNQENAAVVGNYDLKVLKVKEKKKKWKKTKNPLKLLAFEWAYDQLSKTNRSYLAGLPLKKKLVVKKQKAYLVHASPDSEKEHLTPRTAYSRLSDLVHQVKCDLLLFGHSHEPFARIVDTVWCVNPGSVGRPDDGDPRASYALLDIQSSSSTIQHYRVSYNIDRAIQQIRSSSLPEEFAVMLQQGHSLDDIKPW